MKTLVELIAHKRNGGRLSDEDIARVIQAHTGGELADYQMTALLMAIFFRGMDDQETVALTKAMLHSGDVIDLAAVPGIKVDKHSTGGVGDKVSLMPRPARRRLRRQGPDDLAAAASATPAARSTNSKSTPGFSRRCSACRTPSAPSCATGRRLR